MDFEPKNIWSGIKPKVYPVNPQTINEARAPIIEGLGEYFDIYDPSMNPDLENISAYYLDKGATFLVGVLDGEVVCTGCLHRR